MVKRSYDEIRYNLSDETNWLFGEDDYLPGWPKSLTKPDEQGIEDNDGKGQSERQYAIEFGCPFPFSEIPSIIDDGFEACRQIFVQGDQRVLAHYELAHSSLEKIIGDPFCDLLLILVLNFPVQLEATYK